MITPKIQLHISEACKAAAEHLAELQSKKVGEVFREAIAVYLVAHGVLDDVSQSYVAHGAASALAGYSPAKQRKVRNELRARMKHAREALAARRAEHKRAEEEERRASHALLTEQAERLKKIISHR